jgi:hypothetical protein
MPLRLRSAGGGGVTLKSPIALAVEAALEVPAYDGAKLLTSKTPGLVVQRVGGSFQYTSAGPATSSSSFVSTGISQTITPSSSANKVRIRIMMPAQVVAGSASLYGALTVFRNGSNLITGNAAAPMSFFQEGGSSNGATSMLIDWVDAPNSVAAQTYTIYFLTTGSTFQLMPFVQNMGSGGYTFMLEEIAG